MFLLTLLLFISLWMFRSDCCDLSLGVLFLVCTWFLFQMASAKCTAKSTRAHSCLINCPLSPIYDATIFMIHRAASIKSHFDKRHSCAPVLIETASVGFMPRTLHSLPPCVAFIKLMRLWEIPLCVTNLSLSSLSKPFLVHKSLLGWPIHSHPLLSYCAKSGYLARANTAQTLRSACNPSLVSMLVIIIVMIII